jgi:hypothetical protein
MYCISPHVPDMASFLCNITCHIGTSVSFRVAVMTSLADGFKNHFELGKSRKGKISGSKLYTVLEEREILHILISRGLVW